MIRSLSRLSSFYSTSSSKSSLKQLPFTSIRGDGGGGRTKGAYSRGNNRHVIVDNNATHSPDSDASHTPFHLRHPHHKSYFERLRRKEPGPDRDKLLWVRFHGLSGWEKLEFLSALQQKTFILEAFAVYRKLHENGLIARTKYQNHHSMIHLLLYDPIKHKSDILHILETMHSTGHLPTTNLLLLLIQCAASKWRDAERAKAWYDDLMYRKEPVPIETFNQLLELFDVTSASTPTSSSSSITSSSSSTSQSQLLLDLGMEIWQDLLQSAAAPDIDLKTLRHVLSIHGKRGLVDKVQECYDMVMMQGSGSSISGDEQSSSSSLSPSSSSSSVPITVISPKIILGKMKKSTASRNNKKSGSSSFNSIMPPETYLTNYYFDALTSCYTANPSTAINDICTTKFKNIINSTTTISSSTSSSPFIPSSDSVVAILRYAARSGNPKLAALVWKSWILQPIPSSTSSTPVTIPRSARMYHELITLYSNLNDPATAAVIVEEAYTLLEPIYNHSSSTTTTTCSVRNSKTGLRLHLALMHAYAVNGKIHETESMFRELCQKVVGGDDDDGGGSRIHGGWGDRIPKSAYLSLLDVYIKTGDLVKVGEVRAALKRLAEVPVDKEDEVEVDEKEE